jgi:hypothetical protein
MVKFITVSQMLWNTSLFGCPDEHRRPVVPYRDRDFFLSRLCSRSSSSPTSPHPLSFPLFIMRGCLKHLSSSSSSPSPSPSPSPSQSSLSSIATPPPTRGSTPLLIPLDAPSLSIRRRPDQTLTDECLTRRCVHFCSELVDKVFVADEWDRSPAEVTPRLTYQ